ncbi:MAG: ABC transporter permease [Oligoflexia bacterium]|nr:ABC transporter permease [Oligoflexia bacterium]
MFFLAIRHLLSRKKQTALILSGISLGSLIYVAIAGIQLGFREFIVEKLVDSDGHIRITGHEEEISKENMQPIFFPEEKTLVRWHVPPTGKRDEPHIIYAQGWYERLSQSPDVVAYAPQLKAQALFSRGRIRQSGMLIGIDVDKQVRVTKLSQDINEGSLQAIGSSGNRVVVGSGLLKKLGAQLGDTLFLTTGSGPASPFKVVGILETGVHQLDETMAYGSLTDVQQLSGNPGRVSDISVRLDSVDDAQFIANRWGSFVREKVQSWDMANANFLQLFLIQDVVRNFITISIMIVAAFGIYNVLSIIVNQKRREIAILRALGFSPKQVERLFLQQGLILGLIGAVVGLGLGFLLCVYIDNLDIKALGPRGFIISYKPSIYIQGFLMAVAASLVAGFIPARAARKMTPVDIIRSEG